MKKRQPYPAYKPSGIEWLGDIPDGWKIWKVTHGFECIGSGTTPKSDSLEYYDGEIPWVTTSELREAMITNTAKKLTLKALQDYSTLKQYPKNSLIIAMYGATIGRLGVLNVASTVNQACCVFSNPIKFYTPFVFYWLWMRRPILISLSSGGGQPNLSQDDLKQLRIPIPDLNEQRAIAEFLDRETGRIDALIEKKKRQIELLKEKRTALITHAVTKGLNPDAKMKPSGIEWLGDIPDGWEIYRLKYSAGLINQKVDGNEFELPYTGLEHIESWTGKRIVPNGEISSEGQANLYKRGDVLFGKLRPYLAKVHAADADGICTGELLVLRPKAVQQKFLLDYLLNPDVISIVDSSTYGAKMPRANWNFISNLPVLIPPEDDQRAIAEFLDRETARIDALIKKINKSIELLREYRTALISSAVTGKIDVREAAA